VKSRLANLKEKVRNSEKGIIKGTFNRSSGGKGGGCKGDDCDDDEDGDGEGDDKPEPRPKPDFTKPPFKRNPGF
jgi:hypothetical protein